MELSLFGDPKVWAHVALGLLELASNNRKLWAQEVADCGFGISQSHP